MFGTIYSQIGTIVLIAAFAFALWKGDAAERVGGGLNLAAGLFAMFLHPLLSPDIQPVALLGVDAALAAGFLFLAIRFASLWLGAAMMLQAVQFSLHAYYMVAEIPHNLLFARINNIDTLGIVIAIVGGTAVSWRRRVRKRRLEAQKAAAAASEG
ncbi:hypothetical protein ACO2Q3_24970 [Caulobacter sp. KR2-114]|uniref:hypothetical protein n=1 Tax=Caulobacter sp. KR2-114 TaxID=3400912 RepID=UPI003BFD945C